MPKRGKRPTRYGDSDFTFTTDQGWETKLMHSGEVREVVAVQTGELAGRMVKAAPRGPHRLTDEFSIKKNITPLVEEVGTEWVGYVVVEENERARHAMLQEHGYRDPAGHRHAGRFYLKKVLEREAVDEN